VVQLAAAEVGALDALVRAMRVHPANEGQHRLAGGGRGRKKLALRVGCRPAAARAKAAFPASKTVLQVVDMAMKLI